MAKQSEQQLARRKPNYLYAIISVALVLFLLGLFGLITIHAQQLVLVFKEKVNVLLELPAGIRTEDVKDLELYLENSLFTKAGTVTFTSKEEAAKEMSEAFGEDFLKLDLPNPLYDVINFNVKANYLNADSLQQISEKLRLHPHIAGVYYQESLVDVIAKNVDNLSWITLGIGVFFIFVAMVLIHNTIRLALFANRFLIKSMELVGASWEFISRPYLLGSIRYGLISGILAIGGLVLCLYWGQKAFPELETLGNWGHFTLLFIVLILIGMLINLGSTYYVVKKYLKMRVDDLY
ncbi:MAG: permease-like cell division protein FtsX [Saprospiraceae bacterium]